jgi:hypothetical protein
MSHRHLTIAMEMMFTEMAREHFQESFFRSLLRISIYSNRRSLKTKTVVNQCSVLQYVNNGAIFSIRNRKYDVQPKRQSNF